METMHVFEKAGLGVAPFRFIGAEERRGPLRPIDPKTGQWDGMTEIGAPGQPMGCCNYCFQGIAIVCKVRDANGKVFEVGSDCVAKTGDAGLRRAVSKVISEAKKSREQQRIDAALSLLCASATVRAALQALPHSVPHMAADGLTLLDSVEWLMANAGHAGHLRAARMVERAAEGKDPLPVRAPRRERCPDCGKADERKGHQTCEYPKN